MICVIDDGLPEAAIEPLALRNDCNPKKRKAR